MTESQTANSQIAGDAIKLDKKQSVGKSFTHPGGVLCTFVVTLH